jgi:hypothetical protein
VEHARLDVRIVELKEKLQRYGGYKSWDDDDMGRIHHLSVRTIYTRQTGCTHRGSWNSRKGSNDMEDTNHKMMMMIGEEFII